MDVIILLPVIVGQPLKGGVFVTLCAPVVIKPLLTLSKSKKKPGRPRADDWKLFSGIFYVLRTGCQWKALPRIYGAPSTVHDRFQECQKAGLFERMWQAGLLDYDNEKGIDWGWQTIDGAMIKAPLVRAGPGVTPTDRAKKKV